MRASGAGYCQPTHNWTEIHITVTGALEPQAYTNIDVLSACWVGYRLSHSFQSRCQFLLHTQQCSSGGSLSWQTMRRCWEFPLRLDVSTVWRGIILIIFPSVAYSIMITTMAGGGAVQNNKLGRVVTHRPATRNHTGCNQWIAWSLGKVKIEYRPMN